ncbi:hypothetical protein [Lactococcus fujiensis]|uniref:Uncharacterized protein n=1 Tax=Lactococcus fujiensis JCM 16395 TaxID=1291764 RepID=A0A2A5RKM9_9LACT|nr:hypothetical protein [Lactococcus fujiensis]PCR99748.1 hypothetical protein RT41_GL001554 [Lactococcus fujiensis JCM 16395]
MVEQIKVVKVKSIVELESPYADDDTITRYYNPLAKSKEDWARARRSTQDKIREFEEFTCGKFNRSLRGRVTNLKAFDTWLVWKNQTKNLSRKPSFTFSEQ